MWILLQQVTSLRRHAQASNQAASIGLDVIDDGRRRLESLLCGGCRGRSLQCTIALFQFQFEFVNM